MTEPAAVIGVIGAGTMGSGIAQLAAQSGAEALLFDVDAAAAERGRQRALSGIERLAAKGRADAAAAERLSVVSSLDAFADCELVIEAVAERLDIKRELFGKLSRDVPGAVLATNTSSLPVSAIAAGAADPSRVVGMHFFNPPPLMRLVEVVAGAESADDALALADATGVAMGRRVIRAADGIGFIVNRCNRPFQLEALRCVEHGIATPEQVDRIVRLGAGFKMGPFELADLVGMDVGLEVAKSFWEQSFHEPRWRPSALTARLVQAGRHGRKTGAGWYRYADGEPYRPADPEPPAGGGGDGRLVVIGGEGAHAAALHEAAREAGFEAAFAADADGAVPWLIVDCGHEPGDEVEPLQGAPQALLLDVGGLQTLDPEGTCTGFYLPLPLGSLVELTRAPTTSAVAVERTVEFFGCLGLLHEWVGDAPGLVLGRILGQLCNEALFALGEGVGSAEDIDAGMELGLNHPRGPFQWIEAMGLGHIATLVGGLWDEYREERYRPAPALPRFMV